MSPARPSGRTALTWRARTGRLILRTGSRAKRLITKRLVTGEPVAPSDPPLEEVDAEYPVVTYFAETPARGYQLLQWLPVLEKVAQVHPVAIATRSWTMTTRLRETTSIPVFYCRTLDSLMSLYNRIDAKVLVYPNNGVRNFQSLIYRRGIHVHVNHGESDKISMVSNQAKAYDVTVIAGPAARERHRRALINFDLDRLVECGRPQLDLDVPSALSSDPVRRTVMYAPTWWGEDELNNYTSLDLYGVDVARSVLALPDVRLVYRPHPRVATAPPGAVADAHAAILAAIEAENRRLGSTVHLHLPDDDILGLFDATDLLVTDVSSVGLDFLYRRSDAPIMLTDRRNDRERLAEDAPISRATEVVDRSTVARVGELVEANLREDPWHDRRVEMRDHYFGFERGESTRRFLELVTSSIERRDALLAGHSTADTEVRAAVVEQDATAGE